MAPGNITKQRVLHIRTGDRVFASPVLLCSIRISQQITITLFTFLCRMAILLPACRRLFHSCRILLCVLHELFFRKEKKRYFITVLYVITGDSGTLFISPALYFISSLTRSITYPVTVELAFNIPVYSDTANLYGLH